MLWNSNPENASLTLAKTVATALDRDNASELQEALTALEPQITAAVEMGESDSRFAISLAAGLLLKPTPEAIKRVNVPSVLESANIKIDQRELLWRSWLLVRPAEADRYLTLMLTRDDVHSKHSEWRALVIREALATKRSSILESLLQSWNHLAPNEQLIAIEPMTANADSMLQLTSAVKTGTINKNLVNTNQLRKWLQHEILAAEIESIWGKIRTSDNAARRELVEQTLQRIQKGARGSYAGGAEVFERVCAQCHQLNNKGFEVGPNLSGNGRGSMTQLVSNVLDPSLVIGEAFQAITVLTIDGEVVSGLRVGENEHYLKLKIQGGKIVEFAKEDLEQIKQSTQSLMPEGVESQMTAQQLMDLFAYLSVIQASSSADNELIPGTPQDFVQP
jgi:putative heme-binding domain-containing protein